MKIKKIFLPHSGNLLILSVFLFAGILAGALVASNIDGDAAGKLTEATVTLIPGSKSPTFIEVMWSIFKYPVVIFFMAFTSLGTITIPAILALKGYLISFTFGTIIRLYGSYGLILNLSVFGIQTLFLIPCLLVIAMYSFECAKKQGKIFLGNIKAFDGQIFSKRFFTICFLCFFCLIILSLFETYVTPILISASFKNI